jgi:hypothetical protein
MKNFKTILLILCITSIPLANAGEIDIKNVNAVLKKQLKTTDFSLVEIEVAQQQKVSGKYFSINSSNKETTIKYLYTGRVYTSRDKQSNEYSDYLDYIVLFDNSKIVQYVKIIKFNSSHGEGVTSTGWLKQFKGYRAGKMLTVGKEIDAISGATISTNKLTFDIQQKTRILGKIVE